MKIRAAIIDSARDDYGGNAVDVGGMEEEAAVAVLDETYLARLGSCEGLRHRQFECDASRRSTVRYLSHESQIIFGCQGCRPLRGHLFLFNLWDRLPALPLESYR